MPKQKMTPRWLSLITVLVAVGLACSPLSLLPGRGGETPVAGSLQIEQASLAILESFPVQVILHVQGTLPDSCTRIMNVTSDRQGSQFRVEIHTEQIEGDCQQGPIPFERQVSLEVGGLPAGEYQVHVDGVTESFTLATDNIVLTQEPIEPSEDRLSLGQGFSLAVPTAMGGQAELVPIPDQGEDLPTFADYPARVEIVFPGYPLEGTFHRPRIELFPLEETQARNEAAAETIAALEELLQNPPEDLPDPMPFLPIFNAGPMIQAQERILQNESVEGVRYLTQFGQALYPVSNRDLFYTFQGMTVDRSHYVLAVLPVNHPELPDTGDDFLGMDPEEFFDQAEAYFEETELFLNGQAAGSFIPRLELLDQMVLSLMVE